MKSNATLARYLVLANDLRGQIEDGKLLPGDTLPSETDLAGQYGFSRGTVVKAIEILVSEGLVNRRQGAGSYVSGRSLHRRAGKLLSFTDTVKEDGHKTSQKLLDLEPADHSTAQEFGVASPAMSFRRLRYVDGVACAIHRSVVPQSIFGRLFSGNQDAEVRLRRPDFSLYLQMEQSGLQVHEARERVTARSMTAAEAALLDTRTNEPAIIVFRVSYSEKGEILEAVEAAYRADFYTYDTHLVRGLSAKDTGVRIAASTEGFSSS
ncbi:MAG: GntR family transcriptional regulator [Rhizobiaceae bacterium]